ncbi:spore germination protein GerPE [Paenibacillus oralis]|uniref:Spore germination protein GerPE n=1 Tax=Paenibacillus oralis TaxID=2490856 RepID=A0A3P3U8B1_9BACL|nr:spore germination protein GerPE [Paenibacillus oralis]RRJ65828.1 spore germination protein GerPE [Paenibacillus oralis]
MIRTSCVNRLKVTFVIYSSFVHVGDVWGIFPDSQVFALQRQIPVFWGDEGKLEKLPIFFQPFPSQEINEEVIFTQENKSPCIGVNNLYILGISTSAGLQIGNTAILDAKNRTKHIRHLIPSD